jgi:hypothetical protein
LINFGIDLFQSAISPFSLTGVLLPLPIFVSLYFFLKKKWAAEVNGRFLIALFILGCLFPIYSLYKLGVNQYYSTFTPEKWKKHIEQRVFMIDDLEKDYDLHKMSKNEVVRLLGEPTDSTYFSDKHNLVYYLGRERGLFGIDSEWLVIWFDSQERVSEYRVFTD